MALAIATNTGALMAAASASSVNKDMETSMERLSTGKRINSAADDAAGVAIASRLSSEIRGTNQSIRNAQDAQAMIDTAEGAHKEIENILQRMRELAVQAANDTNDSTDRTNLAAEMTQLTTEIDRIASVTTWAGQTLLDGSGGTASDGVFKFQIGGRTNSGDVLEISIGAMDADALGVAAALTPDTVNVTGSTTTSAEVTFTLSGSQLTVVTAASAASSGETFSARIDGVDVSVTVGANGFAADDTGAAAAFAKAVNDAGIDGVTATSAAGVITLAKGGAVSLTSNATAQASITAIDGAITTLNTQRANLGAYSNRLDNTVSNLTNVVINLEGGKGRIEDADFAAESTTLAKSQILQQASTAMLAQANASKQNVLSLLQG